MTNKTSIPPHKIIESVLPTPYGEFNLMQFHDGREEALVLTMGELAGVEDVYCRIHTTCTLCHYFYFDNCGCTLKMQESMDIISKKEKGIIILLMQESNNLGITRHIDYLKSGNQYKIHDKRNYELAAKIIHFFNVGSIRLLTTNRGKQKCILEYGIKSEIYPNIYNVFEIGSKIDRIIKNNIDVRPKDKSYEKIVFVIGDLNIDIISYEYIEEKSYINPQKREVGGTGYNAAKSFKDIQIEPVIYGKVGDDTDGTTIINQLKNDGILSLIAKDKKKNTGGAFITQINTNKRKFNITSNKLKSVLGSDRLIMHASTDEDNANDFSVENIITALNLFTIEKNDIAFLPGYVLARFGKDKKNIKVAVDKTKKIIASLVDRKIKIIFDLVPHDLPDRIKFDSLKEVINGKVDTMISETQAIWKYLGYTGPCPESLNLQNTTENEQKEISSFLNKMIDEINVKYFVLRHGKGNCSKQSIFEVVGKRIKEIECDIDTGYNNISPDERRGFGDRLTADFVKTYYF
ncbi:MAG: hypothetical protein KAR54_03560 [Candidatus Pacebacteria bacterium]|nr:hypothetical protein [Candidatus Paceibacterota bacterium]